MGKDLYDAFPVSRAVFDRADAVLGFSISRLCFQGPQEELTYTQNAQPAIVTATIAAWEAFKFVSPGWRSNAGYAAGLSLGEYSALVAVGTLSFEDAVRLVRQRGQFMEEEAAKNPGRMLSVIGLDVAGVRQLCQETATEIANFNCPGQIVISGGISQIAMAEKKAQEKGAKRVIPLEVSGAFHSSFMKGAAAKLAQELEKVKFQNPSIPVISNVTAKPAGDVAKIKQNLVAQVASSVLWEDSMRYMLAKGIIGFMEFGPGRVLKGLMRRIAEQAQVVSVEKKDDILGLKGED
jgi:[acyl-carrier-protein] S-malonyltransferase